MSELEALRAELAAVRLEAAELRARLETARLTPPGGGAPPPTSAGAPLTQDARGWVDCGHGLDAAQLARYSRHVVLPQFGAAAQGRVARARVLVVGAGGLGSSASLYLAGTGVGTLGISDGDSVELSNLHRQVVHREARPPPPPRPPPVLMPAQAAVGTSKAASAAAACSALNGGVRVLPLPPVTATNARALLSDFDLVLDCTDSPASRYLLSDTAAQLRLPLVSGAALRGEGQVTVLCGAAGGAPCRRCLFPTEGAAACGERCADAGVLGPVPGVIGCLQALEALKLLGGCQGALSGRLLCYDAFSADRPFYCVRLPPAQPGCAACGTQPGAHPAVAAQPPAACAAPPPPPSPPISRISVARLAELRADSGSGMVLVDVRPRHLFEAAALPGSLSLPFPSDPARAPAWLASVAQLSPPASSPPLLVLLCRRGRASALAAAALAADGRWPGLVVDVEGGLTAWRKHLDPDFPEQQEAQ